MVSNTSKKRLAQCSPQIQRTVEQALRGFYGAQWQLITQCQANKMGSSSPTDKTCMKAFLSLYVVAPKILFFPQRELMH